MILIIITASPLMAKKKYPFEDNQLWTSIEISHKFSKLFEAEISEELRYNKNRSLLNQALTDIGGSFKLTDWCKTGVFYRYRAMPEEEDEKFRNEIYANFSFKPDLGKFEISDRIRLHVKFRENKETINQLRNLMSVGYKVTKWCKPYIAAEVFYRFLYEDGDRVNQARYYAGAEFEYKIHSLKLFIMREEEYNTNKAENSTVIGLGYSIEI